MTKRTTSGTLQQQVFDAIATDTEGASHESLERALGFTRAQIHTALMELRRKGRIEPCRQPTLFRIPLGTQRPIDGRGRKRP